jgi:hypothetical protein
MICSLKHVLINYNCLRFILWCFVLIIKIAAKVKSPCDEAEDSRSRNDLSTAKCEGAHVSQDVNKVLIYWRANLEN